MITFFSVSLLGALWTAIFVLTRNLWACTLHPWAWNVAIFATGLPALGIPAVSLQRPRTINAQAASAACCQPRTSRNP